MTKVTDYQDSVEPFCLMPGRTQNFGFFLDWMGLTWRPICWRPFFNHHPVISYKP